MFKQAVKYDAKLRLAIAGPSGSGKTYTALTLATNLAAGAKIALVDTEHGSASKYADLFAFDVLVMTAPFHPARFGETIKAAAAAGYSVLILDSLSHAWNGPGGLLELVDQFAARMKSPNTFAAWKDATPIQNALIEAIVSAPLHIIATMRSKQDYVLMEDGRGKQVPRKIGMAPVQREGFEYEFDVFLDMDIDNNAIVSKTRCPALTGKVFPRPGQELAGILATWLTGQAAPPPTPPLPPAPPTEAELRDIVLATPQGDFWAVCQAHIPRYAENIHRLKNAARGLGFTFLPKTPEARWEMFKALRVHAEQREAAEARAEDDLGDLDNILDKNNN